MKLKECLMDQAWVRPFAFLFCSLAVALGVFIPQVTAEKMSIAATLAGGLGFLRSRDKDKSNNRDHRPPEETRTEALPPRPIQ